MKKYQIQNSIGTGNFSTVFKGIVIPDLTPCAIKILRSYHNIAEREAQLLKKFKHPNIITMIDFQRNQKQSRIILEYLGINTLELYQAHTTGLKEDQVKCIFFQVALGLSSVHSHHIIHRDIKPENILIDKKLAIVKIIDFGLAIEESQVSTDYIATRWYRAPENLLGTKQYSCAIDVFSLGCVIVQLFLGVPLFPGTNNLDQIKKIFSVLGYPSYSNWQKGYEKMQELGIRVDHPEEGTGLKKILTKCDSKFLDLVNKMLAINPKNRITCSQIIKHEYFKGVKLIVPPVVYKKFEDDFLPKSINFKGFLPTKNSKNSSNEANGKQLKINFHNVTGKLKNNQLLSKIVQKPQILRQQKSTSVNSCSNSQFQRLINEKSKPLEAKNEPLSLNRKLSTPTLTNLSEISLNNLSKPNDRSRDAIDFQLRNLNGSFMNKNKSEIVLQQKFNEHPLYIPQIASIGNSQLQNGPLTAETFRVRNRMERFSIPVQKQSSITKTLSPILSTNNLMRLPTIPKVPFVHDNSPIYSQTFNNIATSLSQPNLALRSRFNDNNNLMKTQNFEDKNGNFYSKQYSNTTASYYRSPLESTMNGFVNQQSMIRIPEQKSRRERQKNSHDHLEEFKSNNVQYTIYRQNLNIANSNQRVDNTKRDHIIYRSPNTHTNVNYITNSIGSLSKPYAVSPAPRISINLSPQNIYSHHRRYNGIYSGNQQIVSPGKK